MDENLKTGYKFSPSATIYVRFMLCKLDLTEITSQKQVNDKQIIYLTIVSQTVSFLSNIANSQIIVKTGKKNDITTYNSKCEVTSSVTITTQPQNS